MLLSPSSTYSSCFIQSWNVISPSVVCTVKLGNSSPRLRGIADQCRFTLKKSCNSQTFTFKTHKKVRQYELWSDDSGLTVPPKIINNRSIWKHWKEWLIMGVVVYSFVYIHVWWCMVCCYDLTSDLIIYSVNSEWRLCGDTHNSLYYMYNSLYSWAWVGAAVTKCAQLEIVPGSFTFPWPCLCFTYYSQLPAPVGVQVDYVHDILHGFYILVRPLCTVVQG